MMSIRWPLSLALLVAAAAGCGEGKSGEAATSTEPGKAAGAPMRIAGAANLVKVMEAIVPRFEEAEGVEVDFIPGSSGKLAAQIEEGAPFDLFLAANVKFVDDVIGSGECLADSKKIYARGTVVMWTKEGADHEAPASIDGLADGKYDTIAIAQPDQAPYGAAAKAALEKRGVWPAIEKRIIYGTNIEDTMKLAQTGNAEVALIALSQVVKDKGKHVPIPADLHPPLDQALAVCKNGKQQALGARFVEFMATAEIQAVMKDHGYTMP